MKKHRDLIKIGGKLFWGFRWYFFDIYPRDLERPQWSFVGTVLRQDRRTDELVLRDQHGKLYYLRDLGFEFEPSGDHLALRTEWAEWGHTLDEVFAYLKEIADYCGGEIERPAILK